MPCLTWPKQPTRYFHAILGRLQRWRSKCQRYRIDRYLDFGQENQYKPQRIHEDGRTELVGRNLTLEAAKRSCEDHATAVAILATENRE